MMRVGFVINSRVPRIGALRLGMPPLALLTGWDDRRSPMSFMRFRWVANALRRAGEADYSLYRPGGKFDAVVFLKSMGPRCLALAEELKAAGTRVIFEANVDYYTEFAGAAQLEAMAPGRGQREDAIAMTRLADGVIASSRHLAGVCSSFNGKCAWVPDNVDLALKPARVQQAPMRDGRLQVWWSGMASKLFEFLAAEDAFLDARERIHLNLVMDSPPTREAWPPDVRARVARFLDRVPHTIHRFRGIPDLLARYAAGGIIVSPRTLDTPYNLSHTEWKITLGMACELPAVASPVPAYLDAAAACADGAVSICRTADEWRAALDGLHADAIRDRGRAAFEGVRAQYATEVVARRHFECVRGAPPG